VHGEKGYKSAPKATLRDKVLKLNTNNNKGSAINDLTGETVKAVLIFSLLLVGACTVTPKKSTKANINNKTNFSSKIYGVKGSPRMTTSKKVRKGGGRYQVGKPYKIKGKWYYPKEQPGYNKTGMASWYGPNFHGRLTANGEIYDQYSLSAAHPTLPLPSYARVTNLENGLSLIVRVNDRGPFSSKRIIDLSAQASKMLGYQKKGLTKVRVKYISKARMNGRDARYLMASYNSKDGKFRNRGKFAPGTMIANTMLAGLKPPTPEMGFDPSSPNNLNQVQSSQSQIILSGIIAVPALRPTPLFEGTVLNLAGSNIVKVGTLAPLGYANNTHYDMRIQQAFMVIEKLATTNSRPNFESN
jgi:rare lipoprotein A (peptidoglycan hydrolase)